MLNAALAGPGEVDVENETFTVHNPTVLGAETPMPVLVAALGPVMLQIAGELADGTVLWMADERAIGDHIAPRITKAADNAGRPAPRIVAGIPVCLCANSEIDAAKERANRILAEAETSPNYQKLLDRGDARDVGDLCAAGDEEAILARFKQFADAGVTDLSVRLLPIGETRDELIASKYRTREVIARARPRRCDEHQGPLAGIRILEVGVMLAGPYATMLLADLGAEVIKIEPPGGEISRQVSDSYFASLNRNKQSVCLDLRSEAGRQRLGELVANSHALLVNMKPSAIQRLGLTYEALRRFNERIVCVAMTGFGLDGGDDPAFDYVIQAATGVAAMTGDPDGPADVARLLVGRQLDRAGRGAGAARADRLGPRRPGGRVAARRDAVAAELPGRGLPQRRRRRRSGYPFGAHSYYVPAQLFSTADGYLALFITHDAFWKAFAAEAEIEGFPTMAERAARRDEVLAVVDGRAGHRHRHWLGGQTASARDSVGRGAHAARGAGGHA